MRHKKLQEQLIRGFLGSGGMKGAQAILNLLIAVVLARSLGSEKYGFYSLVVSLIAILAIPAHMGLSALVVREVAGYQLKQQWSLLRGLMRRGNQMVALLSIVMTLAAVTILGATWNGGERMEFRTFLWGFLLVPIVAYGSLRGAALHGLGRVVLGQMPEMLVRPILLLSVATTLAYLDLLDPETAMVAHVSAALVAFFVGYSMLKVLMPHEVFATPAAYATKYWVRSLIPFSIMAGMQVINTQSSTIILALLVTNEQVGIYRVAIQGSNLIGSILGVVGVAMSPSIARLHAAADTEGLQRIAVWGAFILTLLGMPIALLFLVFGEQIITLVFGHEYVDATLPLTILSAGQVISGVLGPAALLLTMAGSERRVASAFVVMVIANIVGVYMLVPHLGISGAALSTVITLLFWNMVMTRMAWTELGVRSDLLSFFSSRARRP